jgi:hypothetical protein
MTGGLVSYPNSQKYRDVGFHPATGRSGSSAIAVRALLGRSGSTDVEVTTGNFDDGSTAGLLASVQLKGFSHAGQLAFVRNFTNLTSGSASFPYAGLSRGTPVQVQAVVRSLDGTRSDVVTVSDAVHMRPDLTPLELDGPAGAPLGAPVNFHGFIMERLGDLGARASCVLYVDGVEAARADNIWVDAGGTVDCAMTHRFTETGAHTLAFAVENVVPGDYDAANNRVTTSIKVVEPNNFSAYSIYASDELDQVNYRVVSLLTLLDGTIEKWDQTYTITGPHQYASVTGVIPRSLAFPMRFQGEMSTNGATFNTIDFTQATGDFVDWEPGYCAYTAAFNGGPEIFVCVYTGGYLNGYTYVQYDWWGADVRYHTDSYVTSWDPSGQLLERYVVDDYSQIGPMVTFGPDFTIHLNIWGAGDTVPAVASGTIPLSPFTADLNLSDPSCLTVPVPITCYEDHFHITGNQGYFDYGAWPTP